MKHLYQLSDEAWALIRPHLPQGKPGKPRVDDRRVISGILHVLKTGCRWRDVLPITDLPLQSTTDITGGLDEAFGSACLKALQLTATFQSS